MTREVDSGKSGDVRDGLSQEPLEPKSESLGPANDDSIPVESLPVDQEPRLEDSSRFTMGYDQKYFVTASISVRTYL